jgi:hypothetical protein
MSRNCFSKRSSGVASPPVGTETGSSSRHRNLVSNNMLAVTFRVVSDWFLPKMDGFTGSDVIDS